jgi:gas vesicle protein
MSDRQLIEAGMLGVAADINNRYGEAISIHKDAYDGVSKNNTDKNIRKNKFVRDLEVINAYERNPKYLQANINQQAGFAAEIKEVARVNAERAVSGDTSTRFVRTDDIGQVNNQLNDIVQLDKSGKERPGTGIQMKFIKSTPEAALKEIIRSKDYIKYYQNNVPIMVPADYYDRMKELLPQETGSLKQQVSRLSKMPEKVDALKVRTSQLERAQWLEKNLLKSHVTKAEAREALLKPELSTSKEITHLYKDAGLQGLKLSAALGLAFSLTDKVVQSVKAGKLPDKTEAITMAADIAKDTGIASISGYALGQAGSWIGSIMRLSSSRAMQALAGSAAPATIVLGVVETAITTVRYVNGTIDKEEMKNELAEKGVTLIGSAGFATIGQTVIPIPIAGAIIGGIVGYVVSEAAYQLATDANLRKELADIANQCKESVNTLVTEYIPDKVHDFNEWFDQKAKDIKQETADFSAEQIEKLNELRDNLRKQIEVNSSMKDSKPQAIH